MENTYKFGTLPDGISTQKYEYPGVWTLETSGAKGRIVVAPRCGHVQLLRSLTAQMEPPFSLLYVLAVSRTGDEPGRYESETALERAEIDAFLTAHQVFLERDGRHNLWIRGAEEQVLVYDRHNVVYVYGDLTKWGSALEREGLSATSEIRFPKPHSHHYHPEFDEEQRSVLRERQWLLTPLQPGDVNPP